MAEITNFDKAYHLYNLLKRRPPSEKSRIIQNLKDTTNLRAAAILEETEISAVSSLSVVND